MFARKSLLTLLLSVFLFHASGITVLADDDDGDSSPTPVAGVAAGPQLKDHPIALSEPYNTPFTVQLRNLLVDPTIQGNLVWSLAGGAPSWLSISGDTLNGNPGTAAGAFNFTLAVKLGDSGDSSPVTLTIISPPVWNPNPVDLGIIVEDQQGWKFDLNTVAKDPTGAKLSFTAQNLPAWMHLDGGTGILSGSPPAIPGHQYVGHFSGIVFTATGPGGNASANGSGDVKKHIHPPKWIASQFTLPNAKEDSEYTQNVNTADYILNDEGATLSFQIITEPPPPWLNITSTGTTAGTIYGHPDKTVLGTKTFSVSLSATIDGQQFSDTTQFQITVDHVNHAPYWLASSFTFGPFNSGTAIPIQSLGQSAKDPDMPIPGDKLTFSKTYNGPGADWASFDSVTGDFTGTPKDENIGDDTWTVTVTDQGGLSATATLHIKVVKPLLPPHWTAIPPINGKEDSPLQFDLTTYVVDPNPDQSRPLTYSAVNAPSWISVSSTGILSGKPDKNALGASSFAVKVSNSLGADTTTVQVFIAHVNHPPFWILPQFSITATEGQAMNISIAKYADDPDLHPPEPGDKLTFSVLQGKPWAQLSADGVFTGTPTATEEGDNQYVVQVADQAGATAQATVIIHVPHVPHPPQWQTPIVVAHAKEGNPYSVNISQYAIDPDHTQLTFQKGSSTPSWLTVTNDGTLTGTPQRADVGTNTVTVVAQNAEGLTASVDIQIIVDKTIHPPYWRQIPLLMPDGHDNADYAQNNYTLADYVASPDTPIGNLVFKKVSGPNWMQVAANGRVTGLPARTDVGPFVATFTVEDGINPPVSDDAKGQVVHVHIGPVIGTLPVFTMKERTVFTQALAPQYLTSPDGDQLHCALQASPLPDWVTLADDCTLTAHPVFADIGDWSFNFKVSDSQTAKFGVLQLHVDRNPRPPVWLQDPMSMVAKTNVQFSDTLNSPDKVKDLDGLPLTFKKASGPDWLTVATNGALSGLPADAQLGMNVFKVDACNDKLCAEATLNILVQPGIQVDTTQVDNASPGAPSENLWMVDNSEHCDHAIRELREDIHVFYEALNTPAVALHHTGMFLSASMQSDDTKNGVPVPGDAGQLLLLWNEGNIVADFNFRLNKIFDECGTNSPIWGMQRFYENLAKMSDVYHKTYFQAGVPMDVMIVTQQMDHYKVFTKSSPLLSGYTPADFARDFKSFHAEDRKMFRINVIAPECPSLIPGDKETAAEANAYKTLVDATHGKYYTLGICDFNMEATLRDYASRVIFAAQVSANSRIHLSKTPRDPSTIKVSIGGVAIPGGTGAPSDQWSYDPGSNSVGLRWDLIGIEGIKPGDQIKIEYRVS